MTTIEVSVRQISITSCKRAYMGAHARTKRGSTMILELKDIAVLLTLLKAYHDELVKNAEDNFELGDVVDYQDIDTKVKNIEHTISIIMDDFKYRMNT